jgi:arylsulfatase A-like enzyme
MVRPAVRSFSWCAALAVSVAGSACGPAGSSPEVDSERPDVVLVVIDTLRPDHLEAYGYERETAPYLAELARGATVFRRAFSTSSWTAPATASLFTGLYPNHHGVLMGFRAQNNSMEEADEAGETSLELVALPAVQTLAEHMKFAGYGTFGVAANINVGSELGFDRGFNEFAKLHQRPAEELVETALGWRERMEAGPYFLYVHLNDVHKPNDPRAPWYEEHEEDIDDLVAKYDSEISYTDQWIQRLCEGLELDGDELLIVVSDHGEEFMDHGNTGHKYSLYGELNRVLMIVRPPGGVPPGELEVNVSLVDVLPTILDVAGIEREGDDGPGRSLLPLLGAGAPAAAAVFAERTLYAHRVQGKSDRPLYERPALWAAIRGPWKFLRDDFAGTSELYDMVSDPAEQEDLVAGRGAMAAALGSSLAEFERNTVRLEGAAVEVKLDSALMDNLNDLGYTGND